MSLINEALKRAELDKTSNAPQAGDGGLLTPVERYNRRRMSPLVGLALVAAVIGAGLGAWMLFASQDRPALPDKAAAKAPDAPQPPQRAKTPLQQSDKHADERPGGEADAGIDLAIAKTLRAVQYYQPPPAAAPKTAGKNVAGDTGVRPTAPKDPKRPAAVAQPPKASTAVAAGRADGAPAASPPAGRPRRNLSALRQGKFKLSAIMQGPYGATAIINGVFLKEGMTLDGAKVLKIGEYTVELELEGRKFVIQM